MQDIPATRVAILTPSFADIVRAHALARPGTVAPRYRGRATSHAELDQYSDQISQALLDWSAPGDRIACFGKNSDIAVALTIGIAKAGMALVPIIWRLAQSEIDYILCDSGAKMLFVEDEFIARSPAIAPFCMVIMASGDGHIAGVGQALLVLLSPGEMIIHREFDPAVPLDAIPVPLLEAGMARLGCDCVQVYGMIDTWGGLAALPPEGHDPAWRMSIQPKWSARSMGIQTLPISPSSMFPIRNGAKRRRRWSFLSAAQRPILPPSLPSRARIAGYQCPKSIDFVEMPPRNPSGNILRRELHEPCWAGLDWRVN